MNTPTETKGTKTMKRSAILSALAVSACLIFGILPSSAAAAPELEASATGGRAMVPNGTTFINVDVKNVGDAPTPAVANSVTVTTILPAGVTATAAVGKPMSSNITIWSCVISNAGQTVTCTGPAFAFPIPAGKDFCTGNALAACPIRIDLKAGPEKGKGVAESEACGGGAAACSPKVQTKILIQDFGDSFGIAPINQPGAETVPAIPGQSAFWAGACDRAAAPAFGEPIPAPGLGSIPSTVWAPAGEGTGPPRVQIPAPSTTAHCIDLGDPSAYQTTEPGVWFDAPDWRLPPAEQAGSHPDGSTTMAFNRDEAGNEVDGAVDNISVDLPPGFVGNPNAVEKCTQEQFASEPPQCSPASQVGVLHLLILARAQGGAGHGNWGNYKIYPVWNLEPRQGRAAEFGFAYASGEEAVTVRLAGKVRTNGDFGVTAFTGQIPAALAPLVQTVTLWGVPWDDANDVWRAPQGLHAGHTGGDPCTVQPGASQKSYIPFGGFSPSCQQSYDPSWGQIQPFFSQETDCATGSVVKGWTDSYQDPGKYIADGTPGSGTLNLLTGDPDPSDPDWKTAVSEQAAISGCENLGFSPDISLRPSKQGGAANSEADSPSGLDVELTIPQNNETPFDPPSAGAPQIEIDQYLADAVAYFKSEQGLATAHLRDTTVTLPEGMTLNPSAADGQGVCTMSEIGVTDTNSPVAPRIRFNNAPVACPESSKVGEVTVETPLLDEADWPTGSVYLAKQGDNPFGSDFAIYIAISSPDRGFIAKLAGRVTPDPLTGRLTTTVTDNPELPFDTFHLQFKAGPRAPLATPVTCGTHTSSNLFASHAQPGNPAAVNDAFQVSSSPAGGCAATKEARPFNLGFSAGSTEIVAGSHSPFTARFTRGDGNQEIGRIELTTPAGLAAKLAGVPYCPEASIAQATARTGSGQGALEQASPSCPAASQVGTTTIAAGAGRTPFYVGGKVYLAGPYKGAPVSMAFIVPAVAGPFDLGVQVVRTALRIDPRTAQVTAVSDSIPQILAGVPLRIRDIRVDIDRPGFIVNPTNCAEQVVRGTVFGSHGAATNVTNRFQIAECARLGFKPKLNLRLFGGVKRGDYQRLRAVVTARPGDANIARAAVTLPPSSFLAQEHIRTVCTRVQFAADACPAASIYGRATAISPLLDAPLSGPVYLRSSDNLLPDLVAALRGPDNQPIEIELAGRTDSKNRGIRNTFDIVPDAAVSKFTLEMMGGKRSLIVNSRDICKSKNKATVRMNGQNGRKHNFRTRVVNPKCKMATKGKSGKRSGRSRPAR